MARDSSVSVDERLGAESQFQSAEASRSGLWSVYVPVVMVAVVVYLGCIGFSPFAHG